MSISSYLALIIIVIIVNVVKSAQKKKEAEEARIGALCYHRTAVRND